MKNLKIIIACLLLASFAQAQKAVKYSKSKTTGLSYVMHKSNKGPKLKLDDVVTLNLKYSTSKDSLVFDSWKMGKPIQLKIAKASFKGDLMDGLTLLTVGDSASFLINADSLFTKTFGAPRPAFIDSSSFLSFTVKIISTTTDAALKAEELKLEKENAMKEDEVIAKYIAEKQITPSKSSSGLMYIVSEPGTGEQAQAGKTVKVHYTGRLLDGTKFDSSLDRNEPIEFKLGQGMVIKGWDEGIALLKVGGKALLIIPSNLAYGSRGAGGVIPPFSPLTFEVELVSVQ
ncbi:MAG: FKBP-type peptidyl-prolyl cis-trans isomerase [Sphingobacteriaceae bacterium]|jgi:FKBP-type peptidyl-prolyl cis-trans isomerase